MDSMSEWVKELFIMILSLTFVGILLPDGNMSKYVRFIFSFIIFAVILSPIKTFL